MASAAPSTDPRDDPELLQYWQSTADTGDHPECPVSLDGRCVGRPGMDGQPIIGCLRIADEQLQLMCPGGVATCALPAILQFVTPTKAWICVICTILGAVSYIIQTDGGSFSLIVVAHKNDLIIVRCTRLPDVSFSAGAPSGGDAASSGAPASRGLERAPARGGASASRQPPCRFGVDCTRTDCKFTHPDGHDPYAAAAQRSSTQACRFGVDCTLSNCWFAHPPGHVAPPPPAKGPKPCRFSVDCTLSNCWFAHPPGHVAPPPRAKGPKPCHYGLQCTRLACHFSHPPGHVTPSPRATGGTCIDGIECRIVGCPDVHPPGHVAPLPPAKGPKPCIDGIECRIVGCPDVHPPRHVAPSPPAKGPQK